jgi:hypothetical protein
MCYDRWSNMIYIGGNGGHVKVLDANNFERRHEFVELYANKRQPGFNVVCRLSIIYNNTCTCMPACDVCK